jgi:hydroxypyruvate isomerase
MDVSPFSCLRFAANLSWLYPDLPFLDRFEAAARDGFEGVECLFPHEHDTTELQARLRDLNLKLVLFNAHPGDWMAGDRGLASLAGREEEFQRAVIESLKRAALLDCPRVHLMAGLCREPTFEARQAAKAVYLNNLTWAAQQAEHSGVTFMVEPINPRDMPGYLLQQQAEAHALVQTIGSPNLQVQMDLYHCQIVEGDLTTRLRQYIPSGRVGHIQIAGVPDRNEPDRGELSYGHVLEELAALGYGEWVGLEYRPRNPGPGGTSAGLSWMRGTEPGLVLSSTQTRTQTHTQEQHISGTSDSGSLDAQ